MTNKPDKPEECPICQRIETKVKSLDMLKGKLSDSEIERLITEVQNSVLKKSDITRGNTMSEEKIVLTKANFDEFYEAQKYILLLVEKMANRMEKHDAILASYGSQLADVMMKAEDFDLEVSGGEGADDEMGGLGEEMCTPGCKVGGAAPAPMAPMAPDMGAMGATGAGLGAPGEVKQASNAYEAGYKAAQADSVRKNGVPTNPAFPYPEFGQRTVSAQDAKMAMGSMEKSFSMKDLADMKPAELNAELKKRGLL